MRPEMGRMEKVPKVKMQEREWEKEIWKERAMEKELTVRVVKEPKARMLKAQKVLRLEKLAKKKVKMAKEAPKERKEEMLVQTLVAMEWKNRKKIKTLMEMESRKVHLRLQCQQLKALMELETPNPK